MKTFNKLSKSTFQNSENFPAKRIVNFIFKPIIQVNYLISSRLQIMAGRLDTLLR